MVRKDMIPFVIGFAFYYRFNYFYRNSVVTDERRVPVSHHTDRNASLRPLVPKGDGCFLPLEEPSAYFISCEKKTVCPLYVQPLCQHFEYTREICRAQEKRYLSRYIYLKYFVFPTISMKAMLLRNIIVKTVIFCML